MASQKQLKRTRRQAKKVFRQQMHEMIKEIQNDPFIDRAGLAWVIFRGEKTIAQKLKAYGVRTLKYWRFLFTGRGYQSWLESK